MSHTNTGFAGKTALWNGSHPTLFCFPRVLSNIKMLVLVTRKQHIRLLSTPNIEWLTNMAADNNSQTHTPQCEVYAQCHTILSLLFQSCRVYSKVSVSWFVSLSLAQVLLLVHRLTFHSAYHFGFCFFLVKIKKPNLQLSPSPPSDTLI